MNITPHIQISFIRLCLHKYIYNHSKNRQTLRGLFFCKSLIFFIKSTRPDILRVLVFYILTW